MCTCTLRQLPVICGHDFSKYIIRRQLPLHLPSNSLLIMLSRSKSKSSAIASRTSSCVFLAPPSGAPFLRPYEMKGLAFR